MLRASLTQRRLKNAISSGVRGNIRTWTSTPFSYVWLRDSCQGPESGLTAGEVIHANTSPPTSIRVVPDGLEIRWNDGHKSSFTSDFLKKHATPSSLQKFHLSHLYVTYASLNEPKCLVEAMTQLLKYGLIFVSGVPTEHKTNDSCELKTLAETFGEIRHTFYGELWDVINIQNSKNIAYTNLDLGLHMDLLYFHNPPKFQALHCLRNRVIGGAITYPLPLQSLHFDALTNIPVAFQYLNDEHHLYKQHPTIQLESTWAAAPPADSSTPPSISHINYSPHSKALYRSEGILQDPQRSQNTYTYTLKEGDCVLFDNRRVLHARTAFEEKPEGEEARTNRWLKGCYLEADAVADRMRSRPMHRFTFLRGTFGVHHRDKRFRVAGTNGIIV
ncbi:Clavaminate synthase-like protein [Coprinellus micaceus]|uniref:Clavaminate synthase-like protein n=1 Tax=Coprinellus micaceus TaxID=71717 RepID=A0A4Y7RJB8_COPMI|nr:Clavaminate synthase-like protein [Coprinellus micaceus]